LREDQIQRPDGSEGIYSYLEKLDFALIIPVKDGGFHLVEQYRYPVRARSWEFPQATIPGLAPAADPSTWPGRSCARKPGSSPTRCTTWGICSAPTVCPARDSMSSSRPAWPTAVPNWNWRSRTCCPGGSPRAGFEAMIRSGVITDDCSVAAWALFLLHGAP